MTLDDLLKRAMDLRAETVAFCDSVGFHQTSSDLMGNLEKVHKSTAIQWAYTRQYLQDSPMKTERARNTETMRHMLARMGRAIDVYLYAKQHGVDAAMIWKLTNA